MRTDDELRAAVLDCLQRRSPRRNLLAATEPCGLNAERAKPVRETAPVLFSENLCWRHDRRLHAAGDGLEAGDGRDDRLARTDVSLDQAHHRVRLCKVVEDVPHHALLGSGQFERQVVDKSAYAIAAVRQRYGRFGLCQRPQVAPAAVSEAAATVEVIHHGVRKVIRVPYDGKAILDAAHEENIDAPYACKGGVCCTCRARLVEGKVEMDVVYGLEPDEIAAGYILTCQSHPRSERLVVDYDG